MKSERRHELQHNELAEWLAKSALAIKPYQNIIFAAVVVVMIGVVAITVWSRIAAAQTAQAWDEMSTAINSGNPEKLNQVIDDYPHTNVAHMAAVVLADTYLGDGCNQLFVNKIKGQHEIAKAIELYQTIREESRLPSLLERTTFGLARAKECQGDAEHIKQAEQFYEDVATKWPNGAYAVAASERLKDLRRPATKKLYDQFAHFEPKPAFSPQPGEPPAFDMNNVPSEPSANIPNTTHNVKPGKSKTGLPLLKTEADTSKEKGKEESKGSSPVPKPSADKKAPEKSGK